MAQGLGRWAYTRGLHDLGNGCYAWLQPDGSWGWSNAGLIVDGDESLIVDTLYDLKLTQAMLDAMHSAEPCATKHIDTLVNTHSNGDHCNGNCLLANSVIIASAATKEEMREEPPSMMAEFIKAAPQLGELGEFIAECFGHFEMEGIEQLLPTVTYSGHLQRRVGDKFVDLIEVGPAHTRGDTLVHVAKDKTIYTGDILFIEGHPIMWAGPVGNWIAACEKILQLDVEIVVPGHGPVTDKTGVRAVQQYLEYVRYETKKRYDAGLSSYDAAMDISLSDYSSWGDAERIVVNVDAIYREISGDKSAANVADLGAKMARIRRERRQ